MSESKPYRTLFVGTLVQDSFLSLGGTDDPLTIVDSPFCRDGENRSTLRGTGLAGALIATLRRLNGHVPVSISGSENGQQPSAWRFFNSHPGTNSYAYRQHVAIHPATGAAADGALFNLETLPPGTEWPFLLEVDTSTETGSSDAELACEALRHWAAGRCLLGREVARGMGWMTLTDLHVYELKADRVDEWPNAEVTQDYPTYVRETFGEGESVKPTPKDLPGWIEINGSLHAGQREDGWGIDSLSVGGHASEELAAAWDERFLAPEGMPLNDAQEAFDPDFAVITWDKSGERIPFIPGSSIRGPLRHAQSRLNADLVDSLFGTISNSAKLLIRDALPLDQTEINLAWLQHHAEDEFAGGAYGSAKFDRVTVMQGSFGAKLVLEDATDVQKSALGKLLELAKQGQIGIGGGQWRGHGWLRWECSEDDLAKLAATESEHG